MKKSIKICLMIAFVSLVLPLALYAQDPNNSQLFQQVPPTANNTQPDPNSPPPPNDAPIDGGLSLLLAAGAAYGVKKYRDGKKKAEEAGDDLK